MALWYWFMFGTHPGVASTNNRAEKAQSPGMSGSVGSWEHCLIDRALIHKRIITVLDVDTARIRAVSG